MSNISRFIGNERGDKICHEDDGCPTELAVLKRFWREQQASTLPEEVANLVELLDEEEVPYEDSLGFALSLTGRTKQYANGKTATLREQVEKLKAELNSIDDALDDPRANLTLTTSEIIWGLKEQVEKLTKELDNVKQVEFPRRVQKVTDALKRKHEKELAAAPATPVSEDRKDAELLDYIQNHGATIQIVPMANRTFGFEVGGLHKSRKLSVREAIDAAMQEDKP